MKLLFLGSEAKSVGCPRGNESLEWKVVGLEAWTDKDIVSRKQQSESKSELKSNLVWNTLIQDIFHMTNKKNGWCLKPMWKVVESQQAFVNGTTLPVVLWCASPHWCSQRHLHSFGLLFLLLMFVFVLWTWHLAKFSYLKLLSCSARPLLNNMLIAQFLLFFTPVQVCIFLIVKCF